MKLIEKMLIASVSAGVVGLAGVGIPAGMAAHCEGEILENKYEYIEKNTDIEYDSEEELLNTAFSSSIEGVILKYQRGIIDEEEFKRKMSKFSEKEIDEYAKSKLTNEQYEEYISFKQSKQGEYQRLDLIANILVASGFALLFGGGLGYLGLATGVFEKKEF